MATKNQKQSEILGDAEFNKKWEQEAQFQFLRKSNDPRFGEISLYKNKSTNDLIFAKEKLVTSKQQASNDIRDLKSRIALNHPNLHRLVGYSTAIQKELCSTNYLTRAYYEFPKTDLQKEINDRKQNGGRFSGDELLNIANQTFSGLNHLHKLDITHGDIRPLNVGYNRDSHEVRILDRLSDPSPLEKLQTNNIVTRKELFLSPELHRKLQGNNKTLKYDPAKVDNYAAGLTLLQLGNSGSANNESIQNIYKPKGEFGQAELDNHLRNFDNAYANSHPGLSKLVHGVLAADESARPSTQQIVDGFSSGQFSGFVPSKVYAEAPVQFETGTAHQPVYSAPPVTEHPVQEHKEETAVLYNADEQAQQKPADNYQYGNSQTYVYNNLATPTTYVNSAPTQTIYYSSAPTHYVSSVPTSYVTGPTTYTYTTENVVSGAKPVYVSSLPTTYTTYSSAPSDTIVHSPQVLSAEGTSTIINSGITTVTVTRMDGTTYTYTVDEKDRDNIVQDYEKHDPRYNGGETGSVKNSYTYAPTETVHRVESVPPTTYVYSTPPTYSTPYKPGSILVSSTQPVTYTNYAYTSTVHDPAHGLDPNVEVRRGSSNPLPVQDRSIKKKYIIEDDKVIEVPQDN